MRILSILILIIVSSKVFAQEPEYYSYLVKGQVQYKKAKAKPSSLAPKTLLYSDDAIILPKGKNAEVTLVDKKSNYIIISAPGTYKVADLPQKAHKEPESITGKYFHMVWEELFQPQKDFSRFKKRNLPGITGGVSRGDCDVLKGPFNESVLGDVDITFSWRNFSSDQLYTFLLIDEELNEVLRLKIRDSQIILNSGAWRRRQIARYYWKVISSNSTCTDFPTYEFQLWTDKEITEKVNNIKASVANNGDTTLYHIQIAELLEKQNMFDEANKYYLSALEQTSDQVLKSAYAAFLLRMGKEKEAELVYMK